MHERASAARAAARARGRHTGRPPRLSPRPGAAGPGAAGGWGGHDPPRAAGHRTGPDSVGELTMDPTSPSDAPVACPGPSPLTGDERFTQLDATMRDFWRYAIPDLRMNAVRGHLAEFLVARANTDCHLLAQATRSSRSHVAGVRIVE